jgi:hypothetical protein
MKILATEGLAGARPVFKARLAGGFYLLNMVTAIFGMFGGSTLVVSGDAGATAAKILAHPTFFVLCFASNVIAASCYVVVTLLLFDLLKPVDRSISLLAAFFSLVGCAIGGFSSVFRLGVLVVLGGEHYLSVFTLDQLHAMALLLLKMEARGLDVGIIFFGFYCLLLGHLIVRAGFMPRAVGVLVALSGLGWLTYLYPPLASSLSSYLPVSGLLGEGSLMLWLLVMGVNEEQWNARAGVKWE